MLIMLITLIGLLLYRLKDIFATWSDMDYVKHLEDMGEFIDREGKEKR